MAQKSFQELLSNAFKNRKRSGCGYRQQARSTDHLCFYVLIRYFVVLDIHLWKL